MCHHHESDMLHQAVCLCQDVISPSVQGVKGRSDVIKARCLVLEEAISMRDCCSPQTALHHTAPVWNFEALEDLIEQGVILNTPDMTRHQHANAPHCR